MREAGIEADVVTAGGSAKRAMFVAGEIMIDCCASPAAFDRDDEQKVQLFSDFMHETAAHFVGRPGEAADILARVSSLRFAKVRGYFYDLDVDFASIVEADDIDGVLELVAGGAADAAIVTRDELDAWLLREPGSLELGPLHSRTGLHLRVNRARADLLPAIDAAIVRLRDSGQIAALLKGLDRDQAGHGVYHGVLQVGRSDTRGTQSMWREILAEAGIRAVFVNAPQQRKRRMFASGRILLDCCASPIWRKRPEEVAVQLWSDTFYVSREIWVFRRGRPLPVETKEDLAALRVAIVRGFDFYDAAQFADRVPGRDIQDTLRLLAVGRADAGILGDLDYDVRIGPESTLFEKGPLRVEAELKIRVHKKVAQLLPRINAAIRRLKERGRLDAIIETIAAEEQDRFDWQPALDPDG